jgi:hypothetical protein
MLEVPQLVNLGGRWRILFSTLHDGCFGTGEIVADDPFGPYRLRRDSFIVRGDLYAARLIEHLGQPWLMAWRRLGPGGEFAGELADPMPVRLSAASGDLEDHLEITVDPGVG